MSKTDKKAKRVKILVCLGFLLLAGIAALPSLQKTLNTSAQEKGKTDSGGTVLAAPTPCDDCPPNPPPYIPFEDRDDYKSLAQVPVPEPDNINEFVLDRAAAIALGKALFWDMQAGSDGVVSCASCHFQAGGDNRSVNQLSPGLARVEPANGDLGATHPALPDTLFNPGLGPNFQLTAGNYPVPRGAGSGAANPGAPEFNDKNDTTTSQGVYKSMFVDVIPGVAEEIVNYETDPVFNVGANRNTRRDEPRNTPTVINAVFNFRNFWDGRAQEDFNGRNPFGARDAGARVVKMVNGAPQLVQKSLNKSSLASQAVGPPSGVRPGKAHGDCNQLDPNGNPNADGANFEMSARCRDFPALGRKMLTMKPLAKQMVATDDSVLGSRSCKNNPACGASQAGLNTTYGQLIQQAFKPEWVGNLSPVLANKRIKRDNAAAPVFWSIDLQGCHGCYLPAEYNFSLFWGLAIQMYEATLVSGDSPFDQYQLEGTGYGMSRAAIRGQQVFTGAGKCDACHKNMEFTGASFREVADEKIENMDIPSRDNIDYDNGFYNIGVRPWYEDLGVGAEDPWGVELSFSLSQNPNNPSPKDVAVNGAFKTASLRNVELTAPFFHAGTQLTLRQVVDFYNRKGDFHDVNANNLDADIEFLGLTEGQKNDLVEFLKALTDERVRLHKAPFDHPALQVTNGHAVAGSGSNAPAANAPDLFINLPEIGAGGYKQTLPLFPAYPRTRRGYDFNNKGKGQISVFRPSENKWYLHDLSTQTTAGVVFGAAGEKLVAADYDGDGTSDVATFNDGVWKIRYSLTETEMPQPAATLGQAGDIPVPADYDRDGKADLAVYRSNTWHIKKSSNGQTEFIQWGLPTDKVAPGDYDGDGKADPAVYRPSTGVWYILRSSNQQMQAYNFGIAEDIPVPGDYDGDSINDYAIWRPSTGVWWVAKSSDNGVLAQAWGVSGDKVTPADYDGDGKTDFAVWRPNIGGGNSAYFVFPSTGAAPYQFGFGYSTDVAVPNGPIQQ